MGGRAALVLALSVLSLLACATPYQPYAFFNVVYGGYTDHETEPGVIYVSFQGNGAISELVILGYWHRRASEICPGGYDLLGDVAEAGWSMRVPTANDSQVSVASGPQFFDVYYPKVEGHIRCLKE